jgi:hypothetical protein
MRALLSRAAERCDRAGLSFTAEQQSRLLSQLHSIEELLSLSEERFKALTAADHTDVRVRRAYPSLYALTR